MSPESPKYKGWLYNDYGVLSNILLRLNEIEGAAKAAEKLPRILSDQLKTYCDTVVLLTKCAIASKDQGPDYGGRAVQVLRKAVAEKVIRDPKQLDLPQFRALKDREDFRRLRESLKPPVAG